MTTDAESGAPEVGEVISPGPNSEPAIDVAATARKRTEMTPTDRIEARADRHIEELKHDKRSLQAELQVVRYSEIPHLRDDLRWLEDRETSLVNTLALLKTSYEWAISFNWFSFGLITIGGCLVSFAAFLPAPRLVATCSVTALLIGVIIQAMVSYRGKKALMGLSAPVARNLRPSPNPTPPSGTAP